MYIYTYIYTYIYVYIYTCTVSTYRHISGETEGSMQTNRRLGVASC